MHTISAQNGSDLQKLSVGDEVPYWWTDGWTTTCNGANCMMAP